MFKKILKIIFVILILFLVVNILITLSTLVIEFYNSFKLLEEGEMFESKTFYSPTKENKVTLMIHTKGAFDGHIYIYIIDGIYRKKEVPSKNNYMKFPEGTGIHIRWNKNNVCNIISSNPPEINSLNPKDYNINLTVSREKIDAFFERGEGDKVIRYQIKK